MNTKQITDPGIYAYLADQLIGIDPSGASKHLSNAFKIDNLDVKAHKVAACHYLHQRNYEKSIHHATECLRNIHKFQTIYANTRILEIDSLFCLAESYFFTRKYLSAEKTYTEILKLAKSAGQSEIVSPLAIERKLSTIKEIKTKSILTIDNKLTKEQKETLRKSTIDSINNERKEFNAKQKACEDSNYMYMHGLPVGLIPSSWFELWNNYMSSKPNNLISNHQPSTSQSSSEKQQKLKYEVDEPEFLLQYPGQIDAFDIVEAWPRWQNKTLFSKNDDQFILKQDMKENLDYVVLPFPVANLLYKRYGGDQIKRRLTNVNDNTIVTTVDAHYQRVKLLSLVTLPNHEANPQIESVNFVYISKYETLATLKAKIWALLFSKQNDINKYEESHFRIWQADSTQTDLNNIVNQYRRAKDNKVFINANLLDSLSTPIDELGIEENDVFIFEQQLQEQQQQQSQNSSKVSSASLLTSSLQSSTQQWILQNSNSDVTDQISKSCGSCGKQSNDLAFCSCELIMYCDAICQKQHRKRHRRVCLQAKEQQRIKDGILGKLKSKQPSKKLWNTTLLQSVNGLCGLSNLGNTCYMNSSLQCLSNIQELTAYIIKDKFINDINQDNPLGSGGHLAIAYANLIKDMWQGTSGSASPWDFKKTIGKFSHQFNGYSQQDSSELLSYLVDGIHEDLNRVRKKPFVEKVESNGKNDVKEAHDSWKNYLKRNRSIITDLMVGQFKSTLICPTCSRVSVTFDPYMSISLPMPSTALTHLVIYLSFRDQQRTLTLTHVYIRAKSTIKHLKARIAEENALQADNLIITTFNFNRSDLTNFDDEQEISTLLIDSSDQIIAYEKLLPDTIDIDFPTNSTSKQKQIQIQLKIKTFNEQSNEFEEQTYVRVFYINLLTPFSLIHLKVWDIFRKHIASQCEKQGVEIDTSQTSIDYLRKEYFDYLGALTDPKHHQLFLENEFPLDFSDPTNLQKQFKDINDKPLVSISLSLHSLMQGENLNKFTQKGSSFVPPSYSLTDCLDLFTSREILDQGNEWYCSNCKEHQQAIKQMDIFETPKILVIHLKRFRTSRVSSIGNYFSSEGQKIQDHIDFPINGLNLKNYVLSHKYKSQQSHTSLSSRETLDTSSSNENSEDLLYDLFAVSNHYGSMSGGHYTAFAKNQKSNKWFEFDDSHVTEIKQLDEISTTAAYLLFYRKRDKPTNKKSSN